MLAAPARADLDGLRGLAVLAVVVHHYFPHALPGGFAGVDLFFVLSGYLVGAPVLNAIAAGRFHWREFLERRARRLFPALAVVLAACLIAGHLRLFPGEYRALGIAAAQGTAFVANLGNLGDTGYFQAAHEWRPLLHLWSLAVEEQFYVLWPLLLLTALRFGLAPWTVLVATAALSLSFSLLSSASSPQTAFYLPHTRIWEFLAGTWAALSARPAHPLRGNDALSMVGLAGLVSALLLLDDSNPWPGSLALWPVTATVICLMNGQRSRILNALLGNRLMVHLGLISYALYLWHWPLLVFARQAAAGQPDAETRWLLLAAALGLAAASTWLVERPWRYGGNVRQLHIKALAATAALALAGLGSLSVIASDGAAARYPAPVAAASLYRYSHLEHYREGRCFITRVEHLPRLKQFPEHCIDGSADAPLVVLWGDSHAAHLYPGLAPLARAQGLRLAQFTVASCPPAIDHPAAWCRTLNADLAQQIVALQPETVILAAAWLLAGESGLSRDTLALLKRGGVRRIVLVGAVPDWGRPLPDLLRDHLLAQPGPLPERLIPAGIDRARQLDDRVRAVATQAGVAFVSPLEHLCDGPRCLTNDGSGIPGIVAWDYGHLTTAGARLIAGNGQRLLGPRP